MKLFTDDQMASYKEKGYIVVDDVLPQEDLDAFARSIQRTIRFQINKAKKAFPEMPDIAEGDECSAGMAALDSINHAQIAEIYDTLLSTPEGFRLTSLPEVTGKAKQLMGADAEAPLFATQCGVLLFMPNDAKLLYTWHKDIFYTVPDSNFVQMWAPVVDDATIELGTLKACPKSHTLGWREQIDGKKEGIESNYRYLVPESAVAQYEQADVPVKLGQALFFDPGLIHRSGNNTSDTCRFTLLGFYHQVENEKFRAPQLRSSYVGKTPDDSFAELFGAGK